jgi:hypothetical protein
METSHGPVWWAGKRLYKLMFDLYLCNQDIDDEDWDDDIAIWHMAHWGSCMLYLVCEHDAKAA